MRMKRSYNEKLVGSFPFFHNREKEENWGKVTIISFLIREIERFCLEVVSTTPKDDFYTYNTILNPYHRLRTIITPARLYTRTHISLFLSVPI